MGMQTSSTRSRPGLLSTSAPSARKAVVGAITSSRLTHTGTSTELMCAVGVDLRMRPVQHRGDLGELFLNVFRVGLGGSRMKLKFVAGIRPRPDAAGKGSQRIGCHHRSDRGCHDRVRKILDVRGAQHGRLGGNRGREHAAIVFVGEHNPGEPIIVVLGELDLRVGKCAALLR